LKVVLLVFWLVIIFLFSSQPGLFPAHQDYDFIIRKLAHFSEYAILAFLMYKGISLVSKKTFATNLWLALIFSSVYAFSDEIHQLIVPGRSGSVRDVIVDIFGILVAVWLILLEREHQQRYPQKKHFVKI
jgi:VanZ family protein